MLMVCLERFVWAVHLDKGREQLTNLKHAPFVLGAKGQNPSKK